MSTHHDNEGTLWPDEKGDPTSVLWSGEMQINGVVYRIYGTRGTSTKGNPYMQLRARERAKTEVREELAPRPSSRARALAKACEKLAGDYRGVGYK